MLDAQPNPPLDTSMVDDILSQATSYHQAGRWKEAESLYLSLVQAQSNQGDAHHNLGVLYMQTGQTLLGLPYLKAALQLTPSNSQYWISYIKGLLQAGEHPAAREMIAQGRKHGLSGPVMASLESQLPAALTHPSANAVAKHTPSAKNPQKELKQLVDLFNQGKFPQVETLARRMTQQFPQHGFPWKALGVALKMQQRGAEALEPMRQAVRLQPQDAEGHHNLATTLRELGFYREAEASCRQALLLKPQYAEAYNSLGNILNDQGRFGEAENACRQALILKPLSAGASLNLGNALKGQGRWREAEDCYRQSLDTDPNFFEALGNLVNVLGNEGRVDEAETFYRRAILLRPDDLTLLSNLLFSMNYRVDYGQKECFLRALEYGEAATRRAKPFSSWGCSASPERLRVGIVSGDLRKHPVGYFLENILQKIDRRHLSLVALLTHAGSDDVTERLRQYFDDWIDLCGVDDAGAAKRIHDENLHLLIDLSGHTEFNRLPVFAWRPAPVQLAWLGYFASTGLAEMDYLLADRVGLPVAQQEFFTEKIWYLPDTRLCFTPPTESPEISALPALKGDGLTFASFQVLAKITDQVLSLWGTILAALPSARLRLQNEFLADAGVQESLKERLLAQGIDPSRVLMYGAMPREQYLAAHAEVDIILDTFPYPGGTTTCEALWMGVPTLTLLGETLLSRQGASLLSAAGLQNWIAETPNEYIAKACSYANALSDLAHLRSGLRRQVAASPLCDAEQFARNFEQALWEIGRRSAPISGASR